MIHLHTLFSLLLPACENYLENHSCILNISLNHVSGILSNNSHFYTAEWGCSCQRAPVNGVLPCPTPPPLPPLHCGVRSCQESICTPGVISGLGLSSLPPLFFFTGPHVEKDNTHFLCPSTSPSELLSHDTP